MSQAELLEKPISPDAYILLRLFENYRGIDRPQDWFDLLNWNHGALYEPATRETWRPQRLSRVLDEAEADGLVEYTDKWMITDAGLAARKAETVRRAKVWGS